MYHQAGGGGRVKPQAKVGGHTHGALKKILKRRVLQFFFSPVGVRVRTESAHLLVGAIQERYKHEDISLGGGGCKAWKREMLAPKKWVERVKGRRRGRECGKKRLTEGILGFPSSD
jgi:hypothetical protein